MWNNEKTSSCSPRLEIDLRKIEHNINEIIRLYASKGISVTGVTKGVCGDLDIARMMTRCGIQSLGDSRIENIAKMKNAGIKARFTLLRNPLPSRISQTVQYADVSLNSELSVIFDLDRQAREMGRLHEIILMAELGDLREGITLQDMERTVGEILKLKNIRLIGLGTNLACLSGVIPDRKKMDSLSALAESIEHKFDLSLEMVSGGNSANYEWFVSTNNVGRINNLRLGESILLGRETLEKKIIPKLYADAFILYAEVIEAKIKPSFPFGEKAKNVLGDSPSFEDRGPMKRAIVGLGLQDVFVSGLIPPNGMEILGATSDHIVLYPGDSDLQSGQEVPFGLNYVALCTAMASPYVIKAKNQ